MYDIIIIGSGPSSTFITHYLIKNYNYKICIITEKFKPFHCTYGIFKKNLVNSWISKEKDYSKLFPYSFDCQMHCPDNNQPLIPRLNTIPIMDEKYLILDNDYCYLKMKEEYEKNNICIIEGNVRQIVKDKSNIDTKIVYYKRDNKTSKIKCKLIIEGSGHQQSIGVNYLYNYSIYYQTFVGYKIKTLKPHKFNKVVLMDWYKPNNSKGPPSFCYFIPYQENILLVEETILCHPKSEESYYDYLEERLCKRLTDYKIEYSEIILIEKNSISINRFIPDSNSLSFGVGIVGNLVNPVSGYSVGLNIFNIPTICKLVYKHKLNTKKIYQEFWNFYRKLIFLNSIIGQKLLLTYSTNYDNSIFFKSFINKSNINKQYFDLVFHNIFQNNIGCILSMCKIFLQVDKKLVIDLLYLINNFDSKSFNKIINSV